jgi:ribonuclease HII
MNLNFENKKIKQGYAHVIGCDEVGRGCLAGPVVAAAVVLPKSGDQSKVESYKVIKSCGIKDSKLLTAKKREELSALIKTHALAWGIAEVSQEVVDEINIHNATLLAMRKAVEGLFVNPGVIPEFFTTSKTSESKKYLGPSNKQYSGSLLPGALGRDDKSIFIAIDGKFTIPALNIEQEAVVGGDNKIFSIAAASIIAKVYRDDLMRKLHEQYPIYNFVQHKGYGTLFHRTMILKNGLSKIHRKSFCKNLTI